MSARRIAWTIVEPGLDILTSDGGKLGEVKEVVGDRDGDIFSGVTYNPGLMHHDRFIPADSIAEITDEGVHVTLDSAAAEELEPYEG